MRKKSFIFEKQPIKGVPQHYKGMNMAKTRTNEQVFSLTLSHDGFDHVKLAQLAAVASFIIEGLFSLRLRNPQFQRNHSFQSLFGTLGQRVF